ncbi:hypothetical protein N7497_008794 [Penicillium chrysogenum]|nr:hypothetical protein N7497_008794 [Penicillium chrysogenum]
MDEQKSVEAFLNLDEIEDVATRIVNKKTWAYYYSASDDKISKYKNTEVFRSIQLRPKVFVDCTECDLNTKLLDDHVSIPIYVSPAAMARLGHPSGEAGIAEACRSFGALQIISNSASMAPEQIVAGAAQAKYLAGNYMCRTIVPRANFITLTLDSPVTGKREDDERSGNVIGSEAPYQGDSNDTGPIIQTEDPVFKGMDPSLTWAETLKWLAKHTELPIVLKGIQTHEDAYIATQYTPQVKGIILSNHGGRSLDTAPPAVHTMLEIRKYCPEVFDKIEVWVDGGIKRGTDVVKALCLGARGVGIGRAALWGLGAGGVDGVKRTLQILTEETKTCMRLLGAKNIDELGKQHINTRLVEKQIYDGPSGLEACQTTSRPKL